MKESIANNQIIQTILKKIESNFKNDISIFACYGSFVTETMNSLSDIDFYVIPKTNRGYEITESFIINDIGYDLWAVTWERIDEISNLTTPITSILMDTEVIYHSSEEDLLKFENSQRSVKNILNDRDKNHKLCMKKLEKLQSDFLELEFIEKEDELYSRAIRFLEDYLLVLSMTNRQYIRKGLHNLKIEIIDYEIIPEHFQYRIEKILNSNDSLVIKNTVRGLLYDIKGILDSGSIFDQRFNSNDLKGFYEEFKSIYNKLLNSCETKTLLKAIYSSRIIDSETGSLIKDPTILSSFPNMLRIARTKDFRKMKKSCMIHEERLLELYRKHGIPIKEYESIEKFRKDF